MAVGRTGNLKNAPLGLAIVRNESTETVEYLMQHLRENGYAKLLDKDVEVMAHGRARAPSAPCWPCED